MEAIIQLNHIFKVLKRKKERQLRHSLNASMIKTKAENENIY